MRKRIETALYVVCGIAGLGIVGCIKNERISETKNYEIQQRLESLEERVIELEEFTDQIKLAGPDIIGTLRKMVEHVLDIDKNYEHLPRDSPK